MGLLLLLLDDDPLGLGELKRLGLEFLVAAIALTLLTMVWLRLPHRPVIRFLLISLILGVTYWLAVGHPPFWRPWLAKLNG